jgi:hypothetical protein
VNKRIRIFFSTLIVVSQLSNLQAESKGSVAQQIYLETTAFNFRNADSLIQMVLQHEKPDLEEELAMVNFYWWRLISGNENIKYGNLLKKRVENVFDRYSKTSLKGNDPSLFLIISICAYKARLSLLDNSYISALNNLSDYYSLLKLSFGRESRYAPFCLTSGLYYFFYGLARDRYPLLTPILSQFHSGTKDQGLTYIKIAAASNDWKISREANYFLMKIYFDIYKNYTEAEKYCKVLLNQCPGNLLYQQYMFRIFLATHRVFSAKERIKLMEFQAAHNPSLTLDEQKFFVSQCREELLSAEKERL